MIFSPSERYRTQVWYRYLQQNVELFKVILQNTVEPQYPPRWNEGECAIDTSHYNFKKIMSKIKKHDNNAASYAMELLKYGPGSPRLYLWDAYKGLPNPKYTALSKCVFYACSSANRLKVVMRKMASSKLSLENRALLFSAQSKVGYYLNVALSEFDIADKKGLFPPEINSDDIYSCLLEQVAFLAFGASKQNMLYYIEYEIDGLMTAFEESYSQEEALLILTDYFGVCDKASWEQIPELEKEDLYVITFGKAQVKQLDEEIAEKEKEKEKILNKLDF